MRLTNYTTRDDLQAAIRDHAIAAGVPTLELDAVSTAVAASLWRCGVRDSAALPADLAELFAVARDAERAALVTTYQLAYLAREVSLCCTCVARDDHDAGALGPVQHGAHDGVCEGKRHAEPASYIVHALDLETPRVWQDVDGVIAVPTNQDSGRCCFAVAVPREHAPLIEALWESDAAVLRYEVRS